MLESYSPTRALRRRVETKPQVAEDGLPPQQSVARRIWKNPKMMHYNRLIALTLFVNLLILVKGVQGTWLEVAQIGDTLNVLSNIIVGNIALAVLIRQQYVINFLFWLATRAPTSWPISIRWTLGKVYHFGGLHVGGAIAGIAWYAIFVIAFGYSFVQGLPGATVGLMGVTLAQLALLVGICLMSTPKNRARNHDRFEHVHRFGGWASLLLFWVQTVVVTQQQDGSLFTSFGFWMLVMVTISIALPWLRLKKVKIDIETPSSHVAIANFDYGVTPFPGSATTISRNPLLEWHAFANVPTPGEDGYRLTISRAGDWTGELIDDNPSHVWVKGIPTAGVANIETLFKRVIYVATGSGIGPCLPHLLANEVPSRLVWSTRNARETYGDALVDEILDVQPEAIIWDTNEHGRPDLMKLAYQAYKDFDAEAIICISNKKLTWLVVSGMESRGIPAYGAIWDS